MEAPTVLHVHIKFQLICSYWLNYNWMLGLRLNKLSQTTAWSISACYQVENKAPTLEYFMSIFTNNLFWAFPWNVKMWNFASKVPTINRETWCKWTSQPKASSQDGAMGCQRKEGWMKATAEKDRGFQEILTAGFVGHLIVTWTWTFTLSQFCK